MKNVLCAEMVELDESVFAVGDDKLLESLLHPMMPVVQEHAVTDDDLSEGLFGHPTQFPSGSQR